MSNAQQSQLLTILVIAAVFVVVLLRRMRPQPVRPNRLLIRAVLIVALLTFSLVSTGVGLVHNVLALVLAPVALAVGAVLGWVLVRTMTFWTDEGTGELWMKGGAVFAVLLIVVIGLRIGVTFALGGGNPYASGASQGTHGWLAGLTSDLLILSMGLWLSRAGLVYQRYRQHAAGRPQTS
ncbi:MAG TPA: CcdC protein domain-containing protein [Candidatus Binatia bacterium]|nr:CcdC protein domain-containing protein [Candidatus Binatia bacterium]